MQYEKFNRKVNEFLDEVLGPAQTSPPGGTGGKRKRTSRRVVTIHHVNNVNVFFVLTPADLEALRRKLAA